jgi:hypothetical protein
MGIEPTTSAWKAEVLPVNYTRIFNLCDNLLNKLTLTIIHIIHYDVNRFMQILSKKLSFYIRRPLHVKKSPYWDSSLVYMLIDPTNNVSLNFISINFV